MKKLRFLLLVFSTLLGAMFSGNALALYTNIDIYFADPIEPSDNHTAILNVSVPMTDGVYHGVYNLSDISGSAIPLVSWDGDSSGYAAPSLTQNGIVSSSTGCTGLDTTIWACKKLPLKVSYLWGSTTPCPWIMAFYAVSVDMTTRKTWTSPSARTTNCNSIPVATYDISWDPNVVQHDKQLLLRAETGMVETTVQTYLMESGTLCDGSKMDDRGAHCRSVATGVNISVLGCDEPNVTTTTVRHTLMDPVLHDIHVVVDTTNIGSGTFQSTCSFRYLIDEL